MHIHMSHKPQTPNHTITLYDRAAPPTCSRFFLTKHRGLSPHFWLRVRGEDQFGSVASRAVSFCGGPSKSEQTMKKQSSRCFGRWLWRAACFLLMGCAGLWTTCLWASGHAGLFAPAPVCVCVFLPLGFQAFKLSNPDACYLKTLNLSSI